MRPGDAIDRYRVERLVGAGGMAAVYQVRHEVLGSSFALKVLDATLAADPEIRDRFLAEGRIQAQLRHAHIASVVDVVATDRVAGLVLEYIEGPSLHDHLVTRGRPLPPDEIAAILLPVLDAVGYAHRKGVVHRDLKPENIILRAETGEAIDPVIMDFGVAKLASGGAVNHAPRQSTRLGSRMGTLSYMAPEQVRNAKDVDARADVFALGAILYEMATGQLPFAEDSDYATMQRIIQGRFVPPGRLLPEANAGLEACIVQALAVERDDRIPDCRAFAQQLSRACGSTRPGEVPPPPAPSRVTAADTPAATSDVTSAGVRGEAAAPPRRSRAPLVLGLVAIGLLGTAVLAVSCLAGSGVLWGTLSRGPGEVSAGTAVPAAAPPTPSAPVAASRGQLKVRGDSASVYAAPDATSAVLETFGPTATFDYHGFDDSYAFYEVRTSTGQDGYVRTIHAELAL